jgi:GDPmannose 4,6-dehydratase
MKRALITGITGQDGSHLAEYLLDLGYEVHGIVRRVALEQPSQRLGRILHLRERLHLHAASLESYPSIFQILVREQFHECYHLAAQSFVAESFADGFSTMSANINGTHYVLEAIRTLQPKCKVYFAGSSEMFGNVAHSPQNERTPFNPRSPYGISKVAGYHLATNYREAYGLYCCSGILFNHEGPRRGFEFVTRKITSGVARIKLGLSTKLSLGNLDARRDWGYAGDYVKAMHAMLQQSEPDNYVVATGESHSVEDFCRIAFAEVGLDYLDHVESDPAFRRPAEVDLLLGDATKAHQRLGWHPSHTFNGLIRDMVKNDLHLLSPKADRGVS